MRYTRRFCKYRSRDGKADRKPEPDVDRECAEVVFVSSDGVGAERDEPLRTRPSGCGSAGRYYLLTAERSALCRAQATFGTGSGSIWIDWGIQKAAGYRGIDERAEESAGY